MLKRFALVALVALALGLVACSGGEKQENTGTTSETATESTTTAATPDVATQATESTTTTETATQ